MASDDESASSQQQNIKLVVTDPVIDVRTMNSLFPKIENLEHFPLKVLLNIFTRLDFMDLHNLADTSCRFESIAKIVLNERYTHEYFTIDESKHKADTYIEFFERFGSEIKSINVYNVDIDSEEGDHWLVPVLDMAVNLDKLTLDDCSTEYGNLLQNHVNESITHLTLLRCTNSREQLILSKFRKLKKLKINSDSFTGFEELKKIVRNNLALESLVLRDESYTYYKRYYPFHKVMNLVGMHLKQLKEFSYVNEESDDGTAFKPSSRVWRQPDDIVDRFIKSLKQLESLALTRAIDTYTDFNGLLRRLSSESKNIKHLKLYDLNAKGDNPMELFNIVGSFKRIESLVLSFVEFNFSNEIVSLVEHLPFLRHLEIEVYEQTNDWSFVLALLQEYPLLEVVTVSSNAYGELEIFGTHQFYKQFIEAIKNPNVKIQVKVWDEIVGTITKDEVIWRGKLLHWTMGYNSSKNLSNIYLLDLAEPKPNDVPNVKQRSPFDMILDYLDLNSLCSLSNASEKCSQLVDSFMKRNSQQNGIFTITNEFQHAENANYDELKMFANHVINLRVNIIHTNINGLRDLFEKFYKLNKLLFYSKLYESKSRELIVPQVRHLISFDEYFDLSDLYELSRICPDLEKFKIDRGICSGRTEVKSLQFRKLKKITFKFSKYNIDTVGKLQALTKDMDTKLCLIYH